MSPNGGDAGPARGPEVLQRAADPAAVKTARDFLRNLVAKELAESYGVRDARQIEAVVDQWMDDEHDAGWRFSELQAFQPDARRILDMASGCGTAVFWGLRNGLDVHGLDPDRDKQAFVALKARAYGYPEAWLSRFSAGVGEQLPYADASFDAVVSYQTLEHVQDPRRALAEMIRVTKSGGCLNLRFPDYRGTFEGHYLLPWLPLMPRPLARAWLRLRGRPTSGLASILYVTGPRVTRMLRSIEAASPGLRLEIVDGERLRFLKALKAKGLPVLAAAYPPYRWLTHARNLFRRDTGVNLFVRIAAK